MRWEIGGISREGEVRIETSSREMDEKNVGRMWGMKNLMEFGPLVSIEMVNFFRRT
jgi:hypothetical protein